MLVAITGTIGSGKSTVTDILRKKGKNVISWEKKSAHARNEPFDLRNYNTAALEILNPNLDYMEQCRLGIAPPPLQQIKPPRHKKSRGVDIW